MALISIQLDLDDKTFQQTLRRVKKSLGELDDRPGDFVPSFDVSNLPGALRQVSTLQGAIGALGSMGGPAQLAAIGLQLGQMAIESGKSAAALQTVEQAFQRLAGSAGASGATMLRAMQQASSGMIADADLMLAANTAMSLGVADNTGEMASLLQVAIAKGAELGVAPMQAFNDLVNGLGRMSPEILNNIGILINAQSAYATYAQSIGATVDQLTEQQKMQALVNATLAANPDAALQSAAAGDTAAAAFARWDVATRQFSEAFGAVFLPWIVSGLDYVTRFVNAVGGIGDALAGKINLTPEEIDIDIADLQRQIGDLQNPDLYFQSDSTTNQVAKLTDQIRMLEQAKAMLTSTATASSAAVGQMGPAGAQAAAGVRQASGASSDLQARLAALSGQAQATQGALRSMWIGAAGALGAEQAHRGFQSQQIELGLLSQGWYMMGLTGEQVEFEKAAWLDKSNAKLQEQVQALTAVGAAASSAGSAVGSMQSDLQSSIASSVSGQVQSALSLDVAWPGKEGAGGDAVNENAKRLAAIANEGLIGQDWLGQFEQEAPGTYADLMLKIAEGMNPQGAAQQLMSEFQAGLRPDLLNFDTIKQQIKDQLTSQQAIQAMTGDITSQLMAEMGVSAEEVQGAMGQLGLGDAGTESAGVKDGFLAGLDAGGIATGTTAKIAVAFKENESAIRGAGGVVGAWWGEGFLATVGTNVPPGLLDMLTAKLLPLIQAAGAQQSSATAPDGA